MEEPTGLNTLSFRWRIRENPVDRIEHELRLVMTPSEADREFVEFPAPLHWLYPFLRLVRLLVKYAGLGVFRNSTRKIAALTLNTGPTALNTGRAKLEPPEK